tara:strand:+ start:1107 stop:1262 length:156 start_codon:yes stop_codon:yes gene_type:complete
MAPIAEEFFRLRAGIFPRIADLRHTRRRCLAQHITCQIKQEMVGFPRDLLK